MSQNWSNQLMPGRVQTPGIQEDFLLQMLQVNYFDDDNLEKKITVEPSLMDISHKQTPPMDTKLWSQQ